jgi:hypothetical protein
MVIAMPVSTQDTGLKRDLSPADSLLDNHDTLDYDAHESEITERTGLLGKPQSDTSTLINPSSSQLDDGADVEAAREQDDHQTNWLIRIMQSLIALLTTMMAGFLTLLPFWILIAFLLIPLW